MWFLAIDVGKINLGFCLFDGSHIKFNVFNIEEQLKLKKYKEIKGVAFERSKILFDFMQSLFNKYEIKKVFIEKQIKANVIAKSIESCLGTITIALGAVPYIYDPKNKFIYLNPKYNSKRKEHKKIVQEYAKTILNTYGYGTTYFESFKKKDDIADALCMVIFSWYEDKFLANKIKFLLLNKYLI